MISSAQEAILVLADGRVFRGRRFGAAGRARGEVVFNTGMTGYQEILTDPSYRRQMVCMTYPHIGNYGVNKQDVESGQIHAAGLIVRDGEEVASSWRSQMPLSEYLIQANVVGISDIDTRALTRHIRREGAVNGVIATGELDVDELVAAARDLPSMEGLNLVDEVTCERSYPWTETEPDAPAYEGERKRCVLMDFGAKQGIMRNLVASGFEVTVVPATTSAADVMALDPDGIMLSNGPGDPAAVGYAVETVKELLGQRPIFGVCLGHQLLSLAVGMKTYKLKFGHHGCNHPVKDLVTGRVAITSQNHGFCVDPDTAPDDVKVTHLNLYDETVEGIEIGSRRAFSVQYHPEAGPGPHESRNLFARFRQAVDER